MKRARIDQVDYSIMTFSEVFYSPYTTKVCEQFQLLLKTLRVADSRMAFICNVPSKKTSQYHKLWM